MTDIERLAMAMQYLMRGWSDCEIVDSQIVKIRHEPLLAQLGYAALIKGSGEPQYGSNPNKADSRPPGNAAPLNLIDRISEEGRVAHRDALELLGDVPSVVPTLRVCGVLHGIMACAVQLQHRHPMTVARMAKLGESWVRSARLLLGYDARSVVLVTVVCDACGGALSAPVDGSGDVVCIGSPYDDPERCEEPCGRTYPRSTWPDLLAERQAAKPSLWTTPEAVAYLEGESPATDGTRWLYNQAREGKIKNYGTSRKALWNSQEVLDQMSRFVGA